MKANTPAAPPLVFYLCDGKRCAGCITLVDGRCRHTSDKRHAKYKDDSRREFEQRGLFLFEKERGGNGPV